MNSDKIILHLCAKEGSDSKPYRDAGYDVRIIGEDIGVENYHPPENVYGIIANPPCTMFSIARTRAIIPRNLPEGMRIVKECLRIIWECQYRITKISFENSPLKFWCLENPASGYLDWFLGRPAFTYNQMEYGMGFSKSTALWGLFNLPKRPLLFNQPAKGKYLGNWAPNHDKDGKRSTCPIDFAMAFYDANP
jgi:hypothetical protein